MIFLFGTCTLDIARRELWRGGEPVPVEPQVFDILVYLIRHRDRVVGTDEIRAAVWGGRAVSDSAMRSRLSFVRRAIGNRGDAQRLIRTYPRKGFRFVGEVRQAPPAPGVAVGSVPREEPPARASATPRYDTPAIAVLPFANLSANPACDALADGIVEDIATALSQFRWLSVLGRGSNRAAPPNDVKRLGRALGVPWVLQGSLRQADGRVRLSVQVVDTASGTYLWAQRFDERLGGVLDVQDRLASGVAGAVGSRLEQAEIERARRDQGEAQDAYNCYLRGMGGVYRWTEDGVNAALEQFRRAIEIDPEFAPAYGMAAYCYVQRKSYGWIADRARENGECATLARQAAAFGKDDAVALARAAHGIASGTTDIDTGAVLVDRALALNPNLAMAWYVSGWTRLFLGAVDEASEHLARAIRLTPSGPLTFKVQAALAYAHFFSRRYDDAAATAQGALALRPNYLTALRAAAAGHALAGRLGEARKLIKHMASFDRKLRVSMLSDLLPFRRFDHFGPWSDALRKAGLPD